MRGGSCGKKGGPVPRRTGPEAAAEKRERVTLTLQNLQDLTAKWTQTIGVQGGQSPRKIELLAFKFL